LIQLVGAKRFELSTPCTPCVVVVCMGLLINHLRRIPLQTDCNSKQRIATKSRRSPARNSATTAYGLNADDCPRATVPPIFVQSRCKRLSQTSTLKRRHRSQLCAPLLRQSTPKVAPCLRQIRNAPGGFLRNSNHCRATGLNFLWPSV